MTFVTDKGSRAPSLPKGRPITFLILTMSGIHHDHNRLEIILVVSFSLHTIVDPTLYIHFAFFWIRLQAYIKYEPHGGQWYLRTTMDPPQLQRNGPSIAGNEKDISVEESQHQSQDDLPPLSNPGSRERILAERKLLRKLDARLLPMIVIIYMMNYIDVCSLAVLPTSKLDDSLLA